MTDLRAFDCFRAAGRWFRGNLHTHTDRSDGAWSVAETIRAYERGGYDFLAITDHGWTSREGAAPQPVSPLDLRRLVGLQLLVIPGIEHGFIADGAREPCLAGLHHVVSLGSEANVVSGYYDRAHDPQDVIDAVRHEGGVPVIAHPYWSGTMSYTLLRLHGYAAIEIYNGVCRHDDKETATVHWDDLASNGRLTWGIACDDAHHPGHDAGQGWVMVKSLERTVPALLTALEEGHFYATQGPRFLDARLDGRRVAVILDRPCAVIFRAQTYCGQGAALETVRRNEIERDGGRAYTAGCTLSGQERYLRVEAVDEHGRRAYTNPIVPA